MREQIENIRCSQQAKGKSHRCCQLLMFLVNFPVLLDDGAVVSGQRSQTVLRRRLLSLFSKSTLYKQTVGLSSNILEE